MEHIEVSIESEASFATNDTNNSNKSFRDPIQSIILSDPLNLNKQLRK